MYISLWENSRGHPDNVSFMQFSTKIDGFEQKDSQGFENSYNSYEQYPLEKFFIFTIYQNYTLAPIDAKCPQNVDFMTFLIITHDIGVEKYRKIAQQKEKNLPFNLSLYLSQSNVRVDRRIFFLIKMIKKSSNWQRF